MPGHSRWGQFDRLVPAATYGQTARERLPGATWVLLPGVGHIPMIDDPDLVARTIMAATGVADLGDTGADLLNNRCTAPECSR